MAWRRVGISLLLVTALALPLDAVGAPRKRRKPVRRAPPPPPMLVLPADPSERDRAIGEAARRALGYTPGAVIAMDPYTGRVMALLNPNHGLEHAYQPCSVFKIVVGIAGLSDGVITPETKIRCHGGCWSWPGHGAIDLRRALAVSCNPFFERVGEQLGYERVQRYAHLLGLGTLSGINLVGETPGRLPLRVAPAAVGHLSSHAAGITTSAVQLAVLLSATLNGGVVFQPQIAGPSGFVPRERWRLPPGTVLSALSDGFLGAVNEGSALSAFDPDVVVAGKTGTCSQVGWFASYAPAERPEVVIVVFTRWGSGHLSSAIAGRIYQELYKPAVGTLAAGSGR